MAGTLTLEDSAFGCWKDYPLPWLCSSVVAGEYDLVSSLWICNDSLKHKIGAKMLLELKNLCVILCDARDFLCPWCRRWCTSRGFLGWLPRGVESCRVFHVLYFVWCSFFFLFFGCSPYLTPERLLPRECWVLSTPPWPRQCRGRRCGESQGSCTSLIDGLDLCQGNVGQRNRNGTWQQLQKMLKLHLCAIAGVISGNICYMLLLLWNHRVRKGQMFLNCLPRVLVPSRKSPVL